MSDYGFLCVFFLSHCSNLKIQEVTFLADSVIVTQYVVTLC